MSVLHVDANAAYLSWTAVHMLEQGYLEDLRRVPAVIAGDPENRQGIVLAKSIPAGLCGIGTGMSLFEARGKCPDLRVFPPDYDLYLACSDAMYEILQTYSPVIQRYSVDECFLDFQRLWDCPDAVETAFLIRDQIRRELGFTVNVGVGGNKVTAKMAGELEKPDRVHTLMSRREIEEKMHPLPVEALFMVGSASAEKLKKINIFTIGELATAEPRVLYRLLKSHGILIWEYANGIDRNPVIPNDRIVQKGISNGMTLPCDALDAEETAPYILALCERAASRLRRSGCRASLLGISLKTAGFIRYSHQLQLPFSLDDTTEIYRYMSKLFHECWNGEPVRQISVRLSGLMRGDACQLTFYDLQHSDENSALNRTVDLIRARFGQNAIYRGTFVNTELRPLEGGVNDGNYMMMGGYRQ